MKKICLILLLTLNTLIVNAQVSIQVKTPASVVEGNKFTVTISITNGEGQSIDAPQIPGCSYLYGPSVSTMHSYTSINGQSTSTSVNEYSFTYKATKAGKVTVPSVSVNINGKSHTTKPKTFTILPPDSKNTNSNDVHFDDVTSQSADKPISSNDVFVRIITSKSSCYEQEAIVCTIKLFTKYSISSFMATQQPAFDGFLSEELNVSQETQQEHYNGQNYYTAVLKQCILYPQKSGKLTISSGKYDLTVEQLEEYIDGPFRSVRPVAKKIKINSNSSSVSVTPLPQPQPNGFNGAVGHFTVNRNLSNDVLRTNETSSLVYTITGTGNIKYLKEPKVNFPESFDLYTPKTDTDTHVNGDNISGTVKYEYTFSPQQVGKFIIPQTNFVYFDPSLHQYSTINLPAINTTVSKGSGTMPSGNIEQQNTDIIHIKTNNRGLKKDRVLLISSPLFLSVYLIAFFSLVIALSITKAYRKRNADVAKLKITRANKVARKRLKKARSYMQTHDYDNFYEELLRAMWGYISDKLTIPVSDLTRQNISSRLLDIDTPQSVINNIIFILDECEMSRYTPSNSDEKVEDLFNKATDSINALESIKRKK